MVALARIPRVKEYDRQYFLERVWRYKAGGHLTILGPTDAGKTQLMFSLLEWTAHPKLPSITLAAKPRDATLTTWSKRLGHRVVRSWPPMWNPFRDNNPPGWVLWPKHTFSEDPAVDDARLKTQFVKAYQHGYKKGNVIINADEALAMMDLGLWRWMRQYHTRARSMGAGLWLNNQGPTDIGRYAYRQAAHLFIAYDPDEEARKRYDQIGGVDPRIVREATRELDRFHFLYIRREGRVMCIIGP